MTNTHRRWLPAAILLCAACTTTAPAPHTPSSAPPPLPQTRIDGEQFRHELEEAYTGIVAREGLPVAAPEVDVEAAASIPIPEHRTINGAVNLFSTRMKNSIQTSLLRSARYRTMIDDALAEQDLPRGFAYLPVIESAYLPRLTSRAGAHGVWQFMPETAREYGLRVDWWIDERADPHRSTKAAARYLRDLYRQFDDWSLVLAAYNCGPGRVSRALERTGATTFWELLEAEAVPKETRGYVPTFYATLIIAGDPATYGFQLAPPEESEDREVEVAGPVSIGYIAEVAGVDPEVIRELNPALRQDIVPPGRRSVRVPKASAALVAERATTMKDEDINLSVTAFQMRRGDTVSKLARKLGTTPETILAMNGLSSKDRLSTGRTIYLPVRARELGALLRQADDVYTVVKGDTLYSIAKRHGISAADLRELNDLSKNAKLRIGQKLRVAPGRGVTAGGG